MMNELSLIKWLILFCYIVGYGIRFYFERLTKSNKHIKSVNKSREDIVVRIGKILFLLPFVFLFSPIFNFADIAFPEWLKWLGIAVLATANIVLFLSHSALGKNWSITLDVHEAHTLTTNGIYRYVRHPMYLGFLLLVTGTFLASANLFLGGILLIWFLVMYFGRINQEEQMMIDEFGTQYEDYMSKTGRLFPKFFQ